MYRFLQKHGKKILAIFSAVLMISFALPSVTGRGPGMRSNPAVGTVGGKKIYAQEVSNAEIAWKLLSNTRDPEDRRGTPIAAALGFNAFEQITKHPVMFFLLQKEAEQMGVTFNEDMLNSLFANSKWLDTGDPDRNDNLRRAFAQLLTVRNAFVRATSPIKVTTPMLDHEVASFLQTINLSVAEFTTAQYKDKVTAPTADELKAQFDKFGDVLRSGGDESNPFGFGYKYPDRLKLQYIGVRMDDVKKAVQASKDPYDWEVEAQKIYIQHQAQFVNVPPATKPSTQAAATTAPTTKPFAAVREEIKQGLIQQAAVRKMAEIVDRINNQMQPDWVAYHRAAGAATRPTTAPSTILGAPYDSFEYLQKVAQRVQQQTGVLPIVVSIADRWLTQEGIASLPGLKDAELDNLPIPMLLANRSAAFINDPTRRTESGVLAELEPTRTAYDATGNTYITRVTAAEAAHKPPTLAEVENDVKNDVITAKAYALAKADAEKLLTDAKTAGSLQSAAAGRSLIKVSSLSLADMTKEIANLALGGDSALTFRREAFKILSTAASKPAKPVRVVELAKDGRIFVAELGDVQALWNDRSLTFHQFQVAQELTSTLGSRFQRDWFDYENVKLRLSYVPDSQTGEKE